MSQWIPLTNRPHGDLEEHMSESDSQRDDGALVVHYVRRQDGIETEFKCLRYPSGEETDWRQFR